MTNQAPNARFIHGHTKITLKPGQTLSHVEGGPTDEGWSSSFESWELTSDGSMIIREYGSDGSDCDGRSSHHYQDQASADPRTFIDGRPQWRDVESDHYDQYAQAAGY